jgi:hypothetical protein
MSRKYCALVLAAAFALATTSVHAAQKGNGGGPKAPKTTQGGGSHAPKTQAPKAQQPKMQTVKAAGPKTQAAKAQAPKSRTPKTHAPKGQSTSTRTANAHGETTKGKVTQTAAGTTSTSTTSGTGTTGTTTTLTPVQQKLQRNTNLADKVSGRLPAGTDLMTASEGFRNLGQFVAAVNVSNNLGIPFTDLKTRMVDDGMSLGRAIQGLRPTADTTTEVRRAETTANTWIGETETSQAQSKTKPPKNRQTKQKTTRVH